MGIGVSIFLMAVGAILAFAVHVPSNGINLDTVGVILIVLGLVGLLTSLVLWNDWTPRSRAVGYDDPLYFSKVFQRFHGRSPTEAQTQRRG